MHRDQAEQAIKAGKKVHHDTFPVGGFITSHDKSNYIFDDGVITPIGDFWFKRRKGSFAYGWEIVS